MTGNNKKGAAGKKRADAAKAPVQASVPPSTPVQVSTPAPLSAAKTEFDYMTEDVGAAVNAVREAADAHPIAAGAAKGALIGSFVPFVGTIVGAGIGAGMAALKQKNGGESPLSGAFGAIRQTASDALKGTGGPAANPGAPAPSPKIEIKKNSALAAFRNKKPKP